VPESLSTDSISATCEMVESRLRFLLGQEYQRRNAVRLQLRLDARAVRKAARLESAAQAQSLTRLPTFGPGRMKDGGLLHD
jgi:hypothetical protein